MIDKGKYSSHGAFIKRLPAVAQAQRQKPTLAVIHPLPSTVPRSAPQDHQLHGVTLESSTLSAKYPSIQVRFRFQSNIDRKPVSQDLVQPFLYIEKVISKPKQHKKIELTKSERPQRQQSEENKPELNKTAKQKSQRKVETQPRTEPFITSVNMKPRKAKHQAEVSPLEAPAGFNSLYEYEEEKRVVAEKFFSRLMENEVHNLKDMFLLWSGKAKKVNADIDIKESEFVQFVKEILPGKIAEKQVRRFFELYMHRPPKGRENEDHLRFLSIKALSFNYQKWKQNQLEVSNILSQKSLKERYLWVKNYLIDFDTNYPALKEAMESIKGYEECLKTHFRQLYQSYQNPYQQEIDRLGLELLKPIIKYDKMKKAELTSKVEALTSKNEQSHRKLTSDFEQFLENYESAVLTNHDLFFTKRTICKLVLPVLLQRPTLTRKMIEEQVELEQAKKEQYLECISEIVVELDKDKKHLGEDSFTLDEVVQLVLMKNKRGTPRFSDQLILYSSKKLIKEVKKQFLIKHQFSVENIEEFPADQEIALDLLHTCFEMECTKVLFKNQIWTELLCFVPAETPQKSALHQHTIDSNFCLELFRRYLLKLDEKMRVELNKSKQISLLAEDVTLEQFQMFGKVFEGVADQLGAYVEDDEEEVDKVEPLQKRKVGFADLVDNVIDRNNFPQKAKEQDLQRQQQNLLIKTLIKSIFQEEPRAEEQPKISIEYAKQVPIDQPHRVPPGSMVQNLADMTSLAKSYFVPEGLNTNSFDIRYYQKEKARTDLNSQLLQPEVVRMGSSILLSNLPKVEQIPSLDPLKISRLLMTNIDKGIQEEKRVVREQMLESSIREGVSHHYYKDKIKLENKPTIYDSEGKSKYSVLLPVGYYQDFVAAENVPSNEKWYLRPHHVQTLTENPLSKKDNVIHTEYQSKLDKLPAKKRPDEFVIQENVRRKAELIQSLEDRIGSLKKDLEGVQRGSRIKDGVKVSSAIVDNYLSKLTGEKEDKDLEIAGYEGVLYDLRRKERELLNACRDKQSSMEGEPDGKWWQRKDKSFNIQLRKERLLAADELTGQNKHREYVDKLKNSEIY